MANASAVVDPIDTDIRHKVVAEVERYIVMARQHYDEDFELIPVLFDLKGKAAGMYRVKIHAPEKTGLMRKWGARSRSKVERVIRFNPWLFAKYPEDSWENTVPHEVAHYLADCLYGFKRIKPHGKEWQDIMLTLGAQPIVRANYNLDGIPIRKLKRYRYQCQCREVMLTSYRHQKIQQGLQRYRCRDCLSDLHFIPSFEA